MRASAAAGSTLAPGVRLKLLVSIAALASVLVGCGGTTSLRRAHVALATSHPIAATTPRAPATGSTDRAPAVAPTPSPQALVTAETENELLVVDLPSGRVARRVTLPADPEDLATGGDGGIVIVVSSRAGKVTVLGRDTLNPTRVFGGFDGPHIVEISPDGDYAYVTDDTHGTLTVIRLSDMKVTSTVSVGAGAHHLAFSPNDSRVWVALGESASTIAILTTVVSAPPPPSSVVVDPGHPRVIGRFDPGFLAHDLQFTPDGKRVWVSAADEPYVGVFRARDHRLLFRVPAGQGPQHIAFDGRFAYIASGYGSSIEQVAIASGRVLKRASAPYGSFELAADDGYVVTSSLPRGTLAIYTPGLRLLRMVKLAPATREVAISRP